MIELRRRYGSSAGDGGGRLPAGYQEVEYLEARPITKPETSTIIPNGERSAYINTGVYADANTSMYIDYAFLGWWDGSNKDSVVGAGSGDSRFYVGMSSATNKLIYGLSSQTSVDYDMKLGERYQIELDAYHGMISIKTKETDVFNYSIALSTGHKTATPIAIFGRSQALEQYGNITHNNGARCWEAIIKQKDILVRHFIPCYRISDRVAGMYDIVNDVFYTNAGTGEFLVGADVHYNIPPEYQQVEYLESTGTQYLTIPSLDTDNDFYINFKINILEYSSSYTPIAVHGYIGGIWVGSKGDNAAVRQFSGNDFILGTLPPPLTAHTWRIEKVEGVLRLYIDEKIEGEYDAPQFLYTKVDYMSILADDHKTYTINKIKARLYPFETNVCTLIPCSRKADNVAGMYDLVSGEFYTNAGTGEFIVGPDVIG